jgi:hypothetical protein
MVELILIILGSLVGLAALLLLVLFAFIGIETCREDARREQTERQRMEVRQWQRLAEQRLTTIDRVTEEAMLSAIARHLPPARYETGRSRMRTISRGDYL